MRRKESERTSLRSSRARGGDEKALPFPLVMQRKQPKDDDGCARSPSPTARLPPSGRRRRGPRRRAGGLIGDSGEALPRPRNRGHPHGDDNGGGAIQGRAGGRKAPQICSGSAMRGQHRPLKRGSRLPGQERLSLVRALHCQKTWRGGNRRKTASGIQPWAKSVPESRDGDSGATKGSSSAQ